MNSLVYDVNYHIANGYKRMD